MWLVTGATGHIGNVLVRQLLGRGKAVRALLMPGESRAPLQGLGVEPVEGDVLDLPAMQRAVGGVEGVFHLAGMISIMPGTDPRMQRVNVEGTRLILRAAQEAGTRRFVYTSSIHALRRVSSGVIDESLPYDPRNTYGEYDRSKAEATLAVQDAARGGMPATIVCPTGVIGPFDFRGSMMGAFLRSAARRRPAFYVDGAYDFVDVRDVAGGLLAAAERGRTGESYILSGHRISVRRMLEVLREVTGRYFPILKIPLSLARLVSHIAPAYYRITHAIPRFTPYSLEVLQSNSNVSHAKARRELGFHSRPITETLADAARWFLRSGVGPIPDFH